MNHPSRRHIAMAIASLYVAALPAAARAQAPADYGPVSANVVEIPYPRPVSTFAFKLYGKDVQMTYVDVKPIAVRVRACPGQQRETGEEGVAILHRHSTPVLVIGRDRAILLDLARKSTRPPEPSIHLA